MKKSVLLHPEGSISANHVAEAAKAAGQTPFYLYDKQMIVNQCKKLKAMPNAFGLDVRYAMKALSTRAILQIIHEQGIKIDASSLNEARRAVMAGIPEQDIMLTSQEIHDGYDREILEQLLRKGMEYNVCSALQFEKIAPIAQETGTNLSMRVHPGVGSGEPQHRR